MFRTVLLSIIRSFSLYTQQWYTTFRFADSLRAISQIYFWNKILHVSDSSLFIIRSFSLYTQQWYMSYRFADSFQAISQVYFWNKTLHVSDSSSVHHQLASRIRMEVGSIPILLASCQQTLMTSHSKNKFEN